MSCRALDPVVLPTEAGEVVKQRLLNFVRSLSTVLAFAYCLSRWVCFVFPSDFHEMTWLESLWVYYKNNYGIIR